MLVSRGYYTKSKLTSTKDRCTGRHQVCTPLSQHVQTEDGVLRDFGAVTLPFSELYTFYTIPSPQITTEAKVIKLSCFIKKGIGGGQFECSSN